MILTYTNIENALESKDNRESFIYNVRFGDNAHCIFCNSNRVYTLKGKFNRFKCAKCRKQFSLIKGTLMENSPIPLHKWLLGLLLVIKDKSISTPELSRQLSVTQKTAYYLKMRINIIITNQSFEAPKMYHEIKQVA